MILYNFYTACSSKVCVQRTLLRGRVMLALSNDLDIFIPIATDTFMNVMSNFAQGSVSFNSKVVSMA